jgi:Phage integrase family
MGELLALHWRDVDFAGNTIRVRASYYLGQLTTPKSGKVRAVPLAPDVATALAQLGRREHWTGDDDLVFVGDAGGNLDGSALRRRYKLALASAGLRSLRFHDLRHTFGTRMIAKADIRRVQEWMGHTDIQTTMRYLHYAPREEDARLVAEASQRPLRAVPVWRTTHPAAGREAVQLSRPWRAHWRLSPAGRRRPVTCLWLLGGSETAPIKARADPSAVGIAANYPSPCA